MCRILPPAGTLTQRNGPRLGPSLERRAPKFQWGLSKPRPGQLGAKGPQSPVRGSQAPAGRTRGTDGGSQTSGRDDSGPQWMLPQPKDPNNSGPQWRPLEPQMGVSRAGWRFFGASWGCQGLWLGCLRPSREFSGWGWGIRGTGRTSNIYWHVGQNVPNKIKTQTKQEE